MLFHIFQMKQWQILQGNFQQHSKRTESTRLQYKLPKTAYYFLQSFFELCGLRFTAKMYCAEITYVSSTNQIQN